MCLTRLRGTSIARFTRLRLVALLKMRSVAWWGSVRRGTGSFVARIPISTLAQTPVVVS